MNVSSLWAQAPLGLRNVLCREAGGRTAMFREATQPTGGFAGPQLHSSMSRTVGSHAPIVQGAA